MTHKQFFQLDSKKFNASSFGFFDMNVLVNHDYYSVDFSGLTKAAQDKDRSKYLTLVKKMFESYENTNDRMNFLFNYTIPEHEKRHYFDIISTTFGINNFFANWTIAGLYISNEEDIIKTLQENNYKHNIFHYINIDKNYTSVVNENLLVKLGNAKVFLINGFHNFSNLPNPQEFSDAPYIAYIRDSNWIFYPISVISIFENIALLHQFARMRYSSSYLPVDEQIIIDWFEQEIYDNETYWNYWNLSKYFMYYCGLKEIHKIIIILEFCLMVPFPINSSNELNVNYDEKQEDPAWRFYYFSLYYHEHYRDVQNIDIIKIINEFTLKMKWTSIDENIENALKKIESYTQFLSLEDENKFSHMDTILYQFNKDIAKKALICRKKYNNFLGLIFPREGCDFIPPIHIKHNMYDNNVEVLGDESFGLSWLYYYGYINIINDLLLKTKQLNCPYSNKPIQKHCDCYMKAPECIGYEIVNSIKKLN